MDLFKNVSVEDFNSRFFIELNAVTEFVQYNSPSDFFDPEQEYGVHIMRCQKNELNFIRSTMKANMYAHGITLTQEEFTAIFQSKREEIIRSRPSGIDQYIERINVTYIDPPASECRQKYVMHLWFCKLWKLLKSFFKTG
ncbi:hypothetical protein [Flavobacterium sp. LC2016-13]|uniref:hypothetical protein n=1 Tax=Flavobacterium sp. LC2016-13 TaxID=2675875 RepID=UPI0012B9465E|nr:hypothetical protein [Flavobacterium sp. LC2016-13]MTD67712.1 hypothetical protein [Flavobacterium sp. LC2016-13]